jgi:hypothetical protein
MAKGGRSIQGKPEAENAPEHAAFLPFERPFQCKNKHALAASKGVTGIKLRIA